MSATELILHEQNLDRLLLLLRVENDPAQRNTLRHLAIAAEDRYGQLEARLDKVDGWVGDGAARIARQRRLVDRLDANSAYRDSAQRLLANLEELQELLVKFRRSLHAPDAKSSPPRRA